ncbi:MAG TPA: LuxR C-terminal-related transcriptional regulator [Gaiellaceae bacterium]|nr:LuxR C-terminal-related transcriptional regulator [Gaiellaceae bacterium]
MPAASPNGSAALASPTSVRGRRRRVAEARPFDFLDSRIQVPALRAGNVSRTGLVNRLRASNGVAAATVVAPAGYGKTTLLAQWAARDNRRFAWVTVDERDNDPVVLLRHIAAALAREEPLEQSVVDALRSPRPTIWAAAVPRLAAELAARSPIALVLDDANLLHARAALEVVEALIDDELEGSIVVLSGRVLPRLPLAPLRARGSLLELGADDLALTPREARMLLGAAGVRLDEARTEELVEQCEGWAAALYLAAISLRDGRRAGFETICLRGDDRYLADYFRAEYLSHLRPGPLRFLRRTAVLERLSGALCDAILDDAGSARELEKIERANLFLVPLDNRREWYRYHHLFRDLLQHELLATEPELAPELHTRAADWFEAHGDRESALEHAFSAGDTTRAAALFGEVALEVYRSGRIATIERWLERFEHDGLLERHPEVAVRGSVVHALRGRADAAAEWLDAAARGASAKARSPVAPAVSVMRAWLCAKGARRMLRDAESALAELPANSTWRPRALLAQGAALLVLGRHDRAGDALAEAARLAAARGLVDTEVLALGERVLLASELDDHAAADELAGELHDVVEAGSVDSHPARALAHAIRARALLRCGRWNEARAAVTAARESARQVGDALPWLGVQIRLELVRALVTLRDTGAAAELLAEARELLERGRSLAALVEQAEALQREIDLTPEPEGAQHTGLTPAELRLLPLLATHLSFREIAQQLFVSRNTIKTQAISVYRKLGVSSRSEAVAEAQRLGLEEHLRVLVTSDH